jgi:AcrR family transcriptional regulator
MCIDSPPATILGSLPRLWNETIDAHRQAVREATLEAAAALVAKRGLHGVTMSAIAEKTGIGRATLYKYFPDVQSILVAWHERQIARHLERLVAARDQAGREPARRLQAVLEAFAVVAHGRHEGELATLLHRGDHVVRAHQQLRILIRDLIAEGVKTGDFRDDVTPDELARYCLHALTAAGGLPSQPAVRRLVKVTLAGLLPPR